MRSTKLDNAAEQYALTLKIVEETADPSAEQVIELLLTRDTVQAALNKESNSSGADVVRLTGLDTRLKEQGERIAVIVDLPQVKETLNRDTAGWWWTFEPSQVIDPRDRFDWVWDILTMITLALAASYMVGIYNSLAVADYNVLATFATIAQGLGLVFISGGALTDAGRVKVETFLSSIKIPSYYHSEAILVISLMFLVSVYITSWRLPPDYYAEEGLAYYEAGQLALAQLSYEQALQLEPKNHQYLLQLGEIYESVQQYDLALDQYFKALEGNPEGFNNVGRIFIQQGRPLEAESYIRMGAQRLQDDTDDNIKFQIYRNLGWALLEQGKYDAAREALEEAKKLDEEIPEDQLGGGMEYCFLAQLYKKQGITTQAESLWKQCLDYARPLTIGEYQWFLKVGQPFLASCIDTTSVIEGIVPTAADKEQCWNKIKENKELSLNERYAARGQSAYNVGRLEAALLFYQEALNVAEKGEYRLQLGSIYESLGNYSAALQEYWKAVEGNPKGFNNVGRVYIQQGDLTKAGLYLKMAEQRLSADTEDYTRFQVYRNLGWVLLEQQRYEAAEKFLDQAIGMDESIAGNQLGSGMSYCFQAQLYTNLAKTEKAEKLWENCLHYARPETTGEYQWFFVVGKPTLAGCIDTDSIIAGGPVQSAEYIKTCWNNILKSGELSVKFEGVSAQ